MAKPPGATGVVVVVVDVHTHMYPPSYVELLSSRTKVPYIRRVPSTDNARLIILPGEDDQTLPLEQRGRPLDHRYSDHRAKLAFMDAHGIDVSVLSLANPWLDFLPPHEAVPAATLVNDGMSALCVAHPTRFYAFGTLPLSAPAPAIVAEIDRLKTLPHMRGVIMGTSGLGHGLDDPALDPVWRALEASRTLMFLHPHYGLPAGVYGPRAAEYGHVLPLALGFPLETTIAVARMLLAGVFDRFPGLRVLLAHSGGTLPFLAGRIRSCIAHDASLARQGRTVRDPLDVLKTNVYLDAVIYDAVGLGAAVAASGADRLMFGTDNPFFPPLDGGDQWLSVTSNRQAVKETFAGDAEKEAAVLGGNAVRVLNLTPG